MSQGYGENGRMKMEAISAYFIVNMYKTLQNRTLSKLKSKSAKTSIQYKVNDLYMKSDMV